MLPGKGFVACILLVFQVDLAILIDSVDLLHNARKSSDFIFQHLNFILQTLSFIRTFLDKIIKLSKGLKALFLHQYQKRLAGYVW